MSLKFGKAQVAAMADVLMGEYETAEEAAEAALAEAERIFEQRAKFVVVGQLSGTKERPTIPPDDPEAIKVSLGWYSTEGDARTAAESLWSSTASGDTYRVWVLPTFHETPAQLHAKAKAKYQLEAEKAKEKAAQRIAASIAARERESQERARELSARCSCGCSAIHHMDGLGKYGNCRACPGVCRQFNKIMEVA